MRADSPPFLLNETSEGWVIYGADDPAETQAAYDELVGVR